MHEEKQPVLTFYKTAKMNVLRLKIILAQCSVHDNIERMEKIYLVKIVKSRKIYRAVKNLDTLTTVI